jgi:hypothetical protein
VILFLSLERPEYPPNRWHKKEYCFIRLFNGSLAASHTFNYISFLIFNRLYDIIKPTNNFFSFIIGIFIGTVPYCVSIVIFIKI